VDSDEDKRVVCIRNKNEKTIHKEIDYRSDCLLAEAIEEDG